MILLNISKRRMMDRLKEYVFRNKAVVITIACAAVAVAGTAITFVLVSQNSSQVNSEQLQQVVEDETKKLEEEIGELTTLPEETPILMTVSDKSLLTDEIFKDAEDGDKVLVYESAGVMVVYRESTNEIIATGKVRAGAADEDNSTPIGVEE